MKDESNTPKPQTTPFLFHFSPPCSKHPPTPYIFQNTLAWVSLLAVSCLRHGSSVISSDSKMRKARVNAFVLCATV